MKIFLLITALSAVFAHDEPNFLRGYDDVLATLEDSCADGEKAGRKAVQKEFDDNCDNAWNISSWTRSINRQFRDSNRSSWQERTFNRYVIKVISSFSPSWLLVPYLYPSISNTSCYQHY